LCTRQDIVRMFCAFNRIIIRNGQFLFQAGSLMSAVTAKQQALRLQERIRNLKRKASDKLQSTPAKRGQQGTGAEYTGPCLVTSLTTEVVLSIVQYCTPATCGALASSCAFLRERVSLSLAAAAPSPALSRIRSVALRWKHSDIQGDLFARTKLEKIDFIGLARNPLPLELSNLSGSLRSVSVVLAAGVSACDMLCSLAMCPNLTSLSISGCNAVNMPSHYGLEFVASKGQWAALSSLAIDDLKLSSVEEKTLFIACSEATHLSYRGLRPANVATLFKLQSLDMSGCAV